jgi:hypothetical protein
VVRLFQPSLWCTVHLLKLSRTRPYVSFPRHLFLQIHRVWEYLVSFIVPMDANRELVPTRYVLICSTNLCFVVLVVAT